MNFIKIIEYDKGLTEFLRINDWITKLDDFKKLKVGNIKGFYARWSDGFGYDRVGIWLEIDGMTTEIFGGTSDKNELDNILNTLNSLVVLPINKTRVK